jgi:hypothetical protein
MNEWLDEWINEWTNEWISGWLVEYGTLVEWYRLEKTEVLRERNLPQIHFFITYPHGQFWDRTWASAMESRRLNGLNHETAYNSFTSHVIVKSKAIPLQVLTGPEGSRRLRLPDLLRQSAHEGGKVVSPTHRPPLPPGNIPGTHFC